MADLNVIGIAVNLYRACASLRFVFCGYGIDNTVNRAVVFNGTILSKQDRTTKTGLTSSTGPYKVVEYVKFMLSHTHMRTCTLNKQVVYQHSHVNHFALPNTFPDLRTSGYGPAK
jgi:hypothetical protein